VLIAISTAVQVALAPPEDNTILASQSPAVKEIEVAFAAVVLRLTPVTLEETYSPTDPALALLFVVVPIIPLVDKGLTEPAKVAFCEVSSVNAVVPALCKTRLVAEALVNWLIVGVVIVGLVDRTTLPEPVDVVTPVPPFATASVPARVTAPVVAVLGVSPVVPALNDVTPPPLTDQVAVVPLDVNTYPFVPMGSRVALFVPFPIIKSPVVVIGDNALKAAEAVVCPVPPPLIPTAPQTGAVPFDTSA
jgi:hypothetical protein